MTADLHLALVEVLLFCEYSPGLLSLPFNYPHLLSQPTPPKLHHIISSSSNVKMPSQTPAAGLTLNIAFRTNKKSHTIDEPQEEVVQTPTQPTFTLPLHSRSHNNHSAVVNQTTTASTSHSADSLLAEHPLPAFDTLETPTTFPFSALRSTADISAPSTVTRSRVQLRQQANKPSLRGIAINTLHMLHHLLDRSHPSKAKAKRHIERVLLDHRRDLPPLYRRPSSTRERERLAWEMLQTGQSTGMFRIQPVSSTSAVPEQLIVADDREQTSTGPDIIEEYGIEQGMGEMVLDDFDV